MSAPNEPGVEKLEVRTELARTMGLLHVIMIGVGAMIGAGIFVLTGIAAGEAGPAIILVFLLNGVVTTLTALSYAELGSCFPEAGGGYLWVKHALPQPNGFLSGWMSWFAHAVACSLYAIAFGAFAAKILSLAPMMHSLAGNPAATKSIAVLITLVFAYINCRGAEETGKAETVVTAAKIVIISVFCFTGLWSIFFHAPHWRENFSTIKAFAPNGSGGIILAMGLTFIAFEGYEIIAQCGEEVKSPRKNIPRAIFISIAVVVPIYMLVAFIAIAGVSIPPDYVGGATSNWAYLGELKELALIHAADAFMPLGGFIFLLGGIFSTMSALNATIYSSSRVSFAMGRDRNLPEIFAKIHHARRTPHVAIIMSAILIIVMAVALPIEEIASATDAMFLLLFILVNIAIINLRKHRPDLKRGFKVPWVPFIPLTAVALNLALAGFLFWHYRLGVSVTAGYILAGIFVYYLYAKPKAAITNDKATLYEETHLFADASYHILTPIANPRSIPGLMKLTGIIAESKKAETIIANVVQVPRQLPASASLKLVEEPKQMIRKARKSLLSIKPNPPDNEADGTGGMDSPGRLPVTSLVKISHNVAHAIVDMVKERKIDLLVLGWRGGTKRRKYFFGSILDDTMYNAECDVVMMARPISSFIDKAERILVPVLFNYRQAQLSLEIASALAAYGQLPIMTLHVSQRPEVDSGQVSEEFLKEAESLSEMFDFKSIKHKIVHAKNVYGMLTSEIADTDIVVIEGIHEGIFSRNLFGDVPDRLAQELNSPVILTKKYPGHVITWIQKFFGLRMPELHT